MPCGKPRDLKRFGINKFVHGEMFPKHLDWLFRYASTIDLGGTIVEIGVLHGLSSVVIAKAIQGRGIRHYCIDNWTMNDGSRSEETKQDFLENMEGNAYFLLDWDSTAAARFFPYNSVDLVFLDGNHFNSKPYHDMKAWWPRVMDGGFFLGHDGLFPGVAKGLQKFFGYTVKSQIFAIRREDADRHTLCRG